MTSHLDDTREAATLIAKESPEAAGLLAMIVASNAEHLQNVDASILASTERDRDNWRERALRAEERLDRILARVDEFLS